MRSIVTNDKRWCFFCGAEATEEHHLIFGSYRKWAENNGIKVPICAKCHTRSEYLCDRIHDNSMAETLSKMLGQAIWECDKVSSGMSQKEANDAFLKECGTRFYVRG